MAGAQAPAGEAKTLRYAFRVAESSFDPAQITDLYSRTVVAGILEAPLEFAYLARPFQMRPATAAAMPEVSPDFKTFTFKIKPGIFFADDPAFKGKKRELVAADYVFSIKRHYDPRWKSGNLYLFENAKILGLSELRKELIAKNKPFDYDREVEGLRVLDHQTFQIRLGEPNPRFLAILFADASVTGAHGARSGRLLWRPHRRAPGGHGGIQAWHSGNAARASCSNAIRTTAKCCTTKRRPPATPALAKSGGATQGPAAADARPRGDRHHRGEPAALAGLPERRGRPAG